MTRIIVISDPHLSPTHGFFWDNWCRACEAVNRLAPDAVIVSGDLCINGPDSDAEVAFARRALDRLRPPVHAIPGNHDVGDEPPGQAADQIIDARRLQRWLSVFGADRFAFDAGNWRVLGINAQLLGSGLPQEGEQDAWLDGELGAGPLITGQLREGGGEGRETAPEARITSGGEFDPASSSQVGRSEDRPVRTQREHRGSENIIPGKHLEPFRAVGKQRDAVVRTVG